MNNIKNLLFSLCGVSGIGHLPFAKDTAKKELSKYYPTQTVSGNIIAVKKGTAGDKTLMIEAHIDEVGFIVTDIDKNGFLTVGKVGGIDLRALPARRVTVHGKRDVPCTFCSVPPHLKKDDLRFDDIKDFKIDSLLGDKASDVISLGDLVTFATEPAELLGNRVTAKSLDDRVGAVCVIELARRLADKELHFNVCFVLSDSEELGTRGAKTAAYHVSPDYAVCIDVSFGNAPDVSPNDCGKLSGGVMIGVSPTLDRGMTDALIKTASETPVSYQLEVMSGNTGTDADVVSLTKSGVKTALLSVPIRNMHTDCEVVDLTDIEFTCNLLEKYVLGLGGGEN